MRSRQKILEVSLISLEAIIFDWSVVYRFGSNYDQTSDTTNTNSENEGYLAFLWSKWFSIRARNNNNSQKLSYVWSDHQRLSDWTRYFSIAFKQFLVAFRSEPISCQLRKRPNGTKGWHFDSEIFLIFWTRFLIFTFISFLINIHLQF